MTTFSSDHGPKTEAKWASKACKNKGKTWIQSKQHMEHENKVDPFFNVEEGFKISKIGRAHV